MKISVITIVYNNKNTIESCLQAVQNQYYANIEHIVIDGGSTDGTQQIIEKYQNNLGYYISEPDTGKTLLKLSGSIGVLRIEKPC